MGKKKKSSEDAGQNPAVVISLKGRVSKILKQFIASKDQVYTFDDSLNAHQRANVHVLCRKWGLKSKSAGPKSCRQLSIFKVEKAQITKKNGCFPLFTISEESKRVLMDFFTHFPPDDCNVEADVVGNRWKGPPHLKNMSDDIFGRPKMCKEEIAKRIELVSQKGALSKIDDERSRLPIASFKDVITSAVQSSQVVLISGETGCGKTTQVPQFLLEDMWGKGMSCKIVCTQPRRISASSVAERISQERGETIGGTIGYKIRFEKKGGRNSSIVLCTNGIFLKVLVTSGAWTSIDEVSNRPSRNEFSNITHIIMDEIHERDCYSDFILAILRDILPSYPEMRLILMSATVNAERIAEYFGGCPIVRVPGFTYEVKTFYLDDVLTLLNSANKAHSLPSPSSTKGSQISGSDNLNNDENLSHECRMYLDEAIDLACANDDPYQLLEVILADAAPKILNYKHSLTGVTPLMVVAGMGRVDDVCLLLSLGADCRVQASDGTTALMRAEARGYKEAVELLSEHMKDAEMKTTDEQSRLDKYLASVDPDAIDVVLIEKLLRKICVDSTHGAILVFLPGWEYINRIREKLLSSPFFSDATKFVIYPLHSKVPPAEQRKVFIRPHHGCRKIILSTNIAETSITIDDIVYVIDSGWMKERSYDSHNNISTVESTWISKASARQREGRSGRCQPGFCYHLYSKHQAESLPDYQVPEIQRMPVDYLCLQIKLLDPSIEVEDFLDKTMDPPAREAIHNAVILLKDIGALSQEEELTELGQKLGTLPIQPSKSKMLLFAIMMNCLDPALTLACMSELGDLFVIPSLPHERHKVAVAKAELASLYGGHSDQLLVVAAFECWKEAKKKGLESRFCQEYFVSARNMRMLDLMRRQLRTELVHNGFIVGETSECNANSLSPGILHAILVVGLYPMVGKLMQAKKRVVIDTVTNYNVRLHSGSTNSKLPKGEPNTRPLVVYNEIIRGDGGMHIRDCTIIGPLPLLLVGADIVVAKVDEDGVRATDEAGVNDSGSPDGEMGDVMSVADNSVNIVIDGWLSLQSTALDAALIYCLRERINAAIVFRVKHPQEALPRVLLAALLVVAYVLSHDAMCRKMVPVQSTGLLMSILNGTDMGWLTSPATSTRVRDLNLDGFVRCILASQEDHRKGDLMHNQPLPPEAAKHVLASQEPLHQKGNSVHNQSPPSQDTKHVLASQEPLHQTGNLVHNKSVASQAAKRTRKPLGKKGNHSRLSQAAKPVSCVSFASGPYGLKGDLLKRRRRN